MKIWHVASGSSILRRMLKAGLRNFLFSAWSHYIERGPLSPWTVGVIRASGGHIFVDSGMISALSRGRVDWAQRQDLVSKLAKDSCADYVAHLDIPMERHKLAAAKLTRRAAMDLTLANARAFLDADVGRAKKVYVIQGWTLEEYRECLRAYDDMGIPDGGVLRGVSMTKWAKKAIFEVREGRSELVVIALPLPWWGHLLLEAGAQVRSLGRVRWVNEHGDPRPGGGGGGKIPDTLFILRPKP